MPKEVNRKPKLEGIIMELKKLTASSSKELEEYLNMRTIETCEGQFINNYIWSKYYNTIYYKTDKYMWLIQSIYEDTFAMFPFCKEEDIREAFLSIKDYFNKDLNQKLKIYLADATFVNVIREEFSNEFDIIEVREYFDYIYDAEKLRKLSGKQYHKKKNHLNSFLKNYTGRYQYKLLTSDNKAEILSFLDRWKQERDINDEDPRLDYEALGIELLLENYDMLDVKIGGIYIDDNLEAFTIGSYSKNLNRAFIHVEKANPEIRGLYPFINQQFLVNDYPDVETVNREDDMGLEGLRKAKMSYNPIKLIEKYNIIQR